MTSRPESAGPSYRTWTALATTALVSLLWALLWALPVPPASAHSELVESTPASGAELRKAPTEVELVFGEGVQQQGGRIVVSTGDTIVSKDSTFAASENVASVQLTSGLPGTYTVAFRVVSADGHIVSDRFAFTVLGGASASPTSGTETPVVDESPVAGTTQQTEDSEDSGTGVVWVLGLGAIGLVLVAAVISVAVRGRRGRSD
jgi:methionine-rich copper-binding protein CopC